MPPFAGAMSEVLCVVDAEGCSLILVCFKSLRRPGVTFFIMSLGVLLKIPGTMFTAPGWLDVDLKSEKEIAGFTVTEEVTVVGVLKVAVLCTGVRF